MNETYTAKQILFGLRKEYIEVEKHLTELKKYVNVSKKVENFYFQIAGNPSELFLNLRKKKNLLEKLKMFLGLYIYGTTNYNVTNGINNSYYYKKKEICNISNQEELNKKIEQIVQTDFFKNILANNHISIPCNENEINTILITAGYIGFLNGINEIYPHLDYYPNSDELIMKNVEKIITPDDIFKLLNLTFDRSYLNEYHHNILDNYKEKEIDIDDCFISNEAKLEIIEEPKKLILKPKNTIKK